jgi:DNA replicative helicase MCM subunit Mcm2 (Cdc46/Mcm family)
MVEKIETTVSKFEQYFSDIGFVGKSNVVVDYLEIIDKFPELTPFIYKNPEEVIKAAQKAIENIFSKDDNRDVLFTNLPITHSLNNIKSSDIGHLISFEAHFIEVDKIEPILNNAVFECRSCMRLHEIPQLSDKLSEPSMCIECGGRSFRLLQEESTFIDTQQFILEGIKPVETRQFKAILKGSLVEYNKFREGAKAEIIAIPKVNTNKSGCNEIILKINNIKIIEDVTSFNISSSEQGFKSNIYFVYDGDCVKIGKADDIKSRLQGLQTGSSKPLQLLYTMKGDERLESFLHELFSDYRKVGEWFRVDGLLEEFLSRGYILGTHETVKSYANLELDLDKKEGRMPIVDRELIRELPEIIKEVMDENKGNASKRDVFIEFQKRRGSSFSRFEDLITKLKRQGTIYEPKKDVYKVV